MGDVSRKATLLLVNERTLSRRLFLAQDAEKQLRKVSVWSVWGLEQLLSVVYFVLHTNVYCTDLLYRLVQSNLILNSFHTQPMKMLQRWTV